MSTVSSHADNSQDVNWRRQALAAGGRIMDFSHNIHTGDHMTKGREALPIRIPLSAEIQIRLVADTNRKAALRSVRAVARHAQFAIDMMQAGVARAFEEDRGIRFGF